MQILTGVWQRLQEQKATQTRLRREQEKQISLLARNLSLSEEELLAAIASEREGYSANMPEYSTTRAV